MLLKIIGYGWTTLAVLAGVSLCLLAAWPLLVGGGFDLAGGRVLETQIGRLDELNREYRGEWGAFQVGLLKIFILEPVMILVVALATRALASVGLALARRTGPASGAAPRLPALTGTIPAETVAAPEAGLPVETVAALEPEVAAEAAGANARGARSSACRVGEAVVLRGIDRERSRVETTLLEVVDPVPAGAGASNEGHRYVALHLRLRNAGDVPFEDLPTGGAVLIGDDGRGYRAARHRMQPALGEVRITPGQSCDGFLTFEVPEGAALRAFRFTPNVGVSGDSGEWDLSAILAPEGGSA